MFGEHGPPPVRTAESVSSAAAEDGSKLLQPSATKGKTTRLIKGCQHTIMEVFVKPCLKCTRMCNCGFNYFSETKYPDVLVRSLDGHLVQLSGEMVRASQSLREMVDKCIFEKKPLKLEEVNVVLERERNGDFNSILKYMKVDINGRSVGGAGGTGNDQVDALPVEASDQPKQRPSFANYPIRNAARNFAKMKAEVKKMREKAKESKADPPVPPVAIETPPASPTPPSTDFTAKKKSRVRYVFLKVEMPPLFKGRQFTHPKDNPIKVEEIDESTTPIADLIELGERNSKILALFDQKSKRPTLGVCKDTLLKIQYFMNMHLDDVKRLTFIINYYLEMVLIAFLLRFFVFQVERKAGAMNRLFQFQDTSAYSDSLFETVCDMKLSNSCGYDDWEEEFFNQMDSQTFLDIQQVII